MSRYKLTAGLIVLILVFGLFSCNGKKPAKEVLDQESSFVEVSIGGMTCLDCEQTIQRNVGKLEGIKSVIASFEVGNALVEYFPLQVDTLQIKGAITGSGYTVKKFITSVQSDSLRLIPD